METSPKFKENDCAEQLTFWSEEPPARTSRQWESEQDLQDCALASQRLLSVLLSNSAFAGLCGRMSRGFLAQTKDEISLPFYPCYADTKSECPATDGRTPGSSRTLAPTGSVGGWRVLDAQFTRTPGFPRGIPQWRKRVLFVGYFGDWTRAAKVLFHGERFEGSSPKNQNHSEPSLFASPEKSHRDKICYGFMSHTGVGYHGITPYREISPTLLAEHNADLFILNGETATFRHQTPLETERLMGFPDNWTRIPWNGKPEEECPDAPRYKACGNSMCVNVMEWIGRRIQMIEDEMESGNA